MSEKSIVLFYISLFIFPSRPFSAIWRVLVALQLYIIQQRVSPIFPIDISLLICYAEQYWLVVANYEGFYFDISMDQSGIGEDDLGGGT